MLKKSSPLALKEDQNRIHITQIKMEREMLERQIDKAQREETAERIRHAQASREHQGDLLNQIEFGNAKRRVERRLMEEEGVQEKVRLAYNCHW